ncbi:hypothetical protein HGP16_18685 [Rhizobium sp. P40RR-XXII]|nr:hypothetical protein [Rhizobium sp. P40RR-XXII]
MIIDGEAVVLDDEERPNFGLLQQPAWRHSVKIRGKRASDAILYVVDLTDLNGHDLCDVEYGSHQHLLEETLNGRYGAIRYWRHPTPNPFPVGACVPPGSGRDQNQRHCLFGESTPSASAVAKPCAQELYPCQPHNSECFGKRLAAGDGLVGHRGCSRRRIEEMPEIFT